MTDGWEEVTPEQREQAENPLRIELHGVDYTIATDTEFHEEEDVLSAVTTRRVLLMDMEGHLHPPGLPFCVPVSIPLIVDRDQLAALIAGLTDALEQVDKRNATSTGKSDEQG